MKPRLRQKERERKREEGRKRPKNETSVSTIEYMNERLRQIYRGYVSAVYVPLYDAAGNATRAPLQSFERVFHGGFFFRFFFLFFQGEGGFNKTLLCRETCAGHDIFVFSTFPIVKRAKLQRTRTTRENT